MPAEETTMPAACFDWIKTSTFYFYIDILLNDASLPAQGSKPQGQSLNISKIAS
jgi:hypothetical protein